MAVKKFIIKQITNWNGTGEKSGTHTVQMDESAVAGYIAELDGKLEVYEQSLTLSVDAPVTTTSAEIVDRIVVRHSIRKPLYISYSNKRPIVLKNKVSTVEAVIEAMTPFEAPYSADRPTNAQCVTGSKDSM